MYWQNFNNGAKSFMSRKGTSLRHKKRETSSSGTMAQADIVGGRGEGPRWAPKV